MRAALPTFMAATLALSACGLTPSQQKWIAVGVTVVGTGLIIAHESDRGGRSQVITGSKGCSFSAGAHFCAGQPVGK